MKIPGVLKNYKLIGIIVLLIILGVVFRGQIKSQISPQPEYKTTKSKIRDLTEAVSASGKVRADEEATLKFQTSGYLNWVGVKKGDKVKKWQTIATLDKEKLEQTLKQELIDYMNERWDFEQDQDDYHTGNKPPTEVAVNDEIKRILEKVQFDLDRDIIDVEIANLAIKYANLWTPIDGIVTEVEAPHAGVNITAATAEFVISNPDMLVFTAKIDEADIGLVKEGQKAIIFLDSYPDKELESEVIQVEFTSTTTTSGGTAFEVKFQLPENIDEKYKIGMNGDVDVIISERKNILTVPFEAVREKDDQEYIWVLKNEKPVKKEVKSGFSGDDYTQILEGIEEGEQVITSNFTTIERNSKD